MELIRLKDALNHSRPIKPALLLGNGFSQLFSKKFNYTNLLNVACEKIEIDNRLPERIQDIFREMDSCDFEKILACLILSAKIDTYYKAPELIDKIEFDIKLIKKAFIESLLYIHPQNTEEIDSNLIKVLIKFLHNFKSIYTTNYDLFLYWLIMCSKNGLNSEQIPINDGFLREKQDNNRLIWCNKKNQNVFFIHGGFHIYSDYETYKEENSGLKDYNLDYKNLLSVTKANILRNLYPLIIFEGNSKEKLIQINKSPYLKTALEEFKKDNSNLFIFGSSINEIGDEHIIDNIKLRKTNAVYISYFKTYHCLIRSIHRIESSGKKVFLFNSEDINDL